jgi:threonine-phosphate decarboxylase
VKQDIVLPSHGGQLIRIAELFGISPSGLLDFSANINPDGPPSSVLEALRNALNDPGVLSQYPDLEETHLRTSISRYAGVEPETVAVANGFVPLLDAVLRILPIQRCLLPVPAFDEYRRALDRARVLATPIVLEQELDFRYQPGELLKQLTVGRHDAILLANPQNPSGVLWQRANLIAFVEEAMRRNVHVLLDEAFIDYAPVHSLVNQVERFAKLIVFRSVTKFYGIPGIRGAYAVTNGRANAMIRRSLPPWSITNLAAIAVRAAVEDTVFAQHTLQVNLDRKEKLATQLRGFGLHTYPAAANFLLIRFHSHEDAHRLWGRLILDHGIVLRSCTNFEALTHDHLRCAVRDEGQNSRLIGAIRAM